MYSKTWFLTDVLKIYHIVVNPSLSKILNAGTYYLVVTSKSLSVLLINLWFFVAELHTFILQTLADEGYFNSRDVFHRFVWLLKLCASIRSTVVALYPHAFVYTRTYMYTHRACLAYAMLVYLERDLAEFVEGWNSHLIRRNHLAACPSGVPNETYEFPALYGNTRYSVTNYPVLYIYRYYRFFKGVSCWGVAGCYGVRVGTSCIFLLGPIQGVGWLYHNARLSYESSGHHSK